MLGAVFAVALLAAVGLVAARRARETAPRAPVDSMTAGQALTVAAESTRAGSFIASLPPFRRAATVSTEFRVHRELVRTLFAAGYERDANQDLRLRSSVERVGLMHEAIGEIEIVNRLGASGTERAEALRVFAEMMLDWGLPWEAFVLYRKAEQADPGELAHTARAEAFMTLLEHPHRFSLGSVPVRVPEEMAR